jgi:phage regulator Rha-like protein
MRPKLYYKNNIKAYSMAVRRVAGCVKSKRGEILALCNPYEDWAFIMKNGAIIEIENEINSYYIRKGGKKVEIIVRNGSSAKYLTTASDLTGKNLLLDLPEC